MLQSILQRRRLLLVLVVVVALVAGVVGYGLSRGGGGSGPEISPVAFSPHPERRFLTGGIGSGKAEAAGRSVPQFTDAEYYDIARNYGLMVFNKGHGGWEIALHHEATRRLHDLNPKMEIYAYISTKYWFKASEWDDSCTADPTCAVPNAETSRSGQPSINPAWLLKDNGGSPIPVNSKAEEGTSYFVDVTNPAYRAWILGVARQWLSRAPYTGIRFDAASPIGDAGENDMSLWKSSLCQPNELVRLDPDAGRTPATECARVKAYNDGIQRLFAEAHELRQGNGTPAKLFFNGVSPSPIRGPDRDQFYLRTMDGAMDEGFCTHVVPDDNEGGDEDDNGGKASQAPSRDADPGVKADIELMKAHPDKNLQLRAGYSEGIADRKGLSSLQQIERLCVGSFLMGWQPGKHYFNMGTGYGFEQLTQQPREIDLNLGDPLGPYREKGNVLSRAFQNGVVYVNTESPGAKVQLSGNLTQIEAGHEGHKYTDGATFELGGQDAAFFLNTSFLSSPSR